MARPTGLEPATAGLEGRCSIRLSYRRRNPGPVGRGRGIRTPDILLPKQARYQTALYPAGSGCIAFRTVTEGAAWYASRPATSTTNPTENLPYRYRLNEAGRFRAPLRLNHIGAPGEIRTPDHQVRSLVLYPTELRAQARSEIMKRSCKLVNTSAEFFSRIPPKNERPRRAVVNWRSERDSNPR